MTILPGTMKSIPVAVLALFIVGATEAATAKKWYPGHYIYATPNTIESWNETKAILGTAGAEFKGYVVRHLWRNLESSKDAYDFSAIKTQLDRAQSEGRKVQVFIDERIYGTIGTEPPDCVPDYMLTDPVYQGGQYKVWESQDYSKCFAKLWVPEVAERYGALLKALGAQLDGHVALAVIIQPETALSDALEQPDFTADGMIDGRLTIAHRAQEAFPTTIFNLIVNARGGIPNDDVPLWFDPHVIDYNHSFGAPNPASYDSGVVEWKDEVIPYGYGYTEYKNIAPIVMQFQDNWDFLSPKEFIDHMVIEQNVHLVGWHRVTMLGGSKDAIFTIYDVIEQIKKPGYVSYISEPPLNALVKTAVFTSAAQYDGYLLEAGEDLDAGGTATSTGTGPNGLRVGDDAGDKQYKSIVSFDTRSLPDNATIVSARLWLKCGSVQGDDPFGTHGTCHVDVKRWNFNSNTALEPADFQAAATAVQAAVMSEVFQNGEWSAGELTEAGCDAINLLNGNTQMRIYFSRDDNDDRAADYVGFYCGGNSDPDKHPVLVVDYYVD